LRKEYTEKRNLSGYVNLIHGNHSSPTPGVPKDSEGGVFLSNIYPFTRKPMPVYFLLTKSFI